VEELVDQAPTVEALRAHRIHLFAARTWRSRGSAIPADLAAVERCSAVIATAAPLLLGRARAAYDGPLMLMKGPEMAARYPDPMDRPFCDLDLVAEDPDAAQQALIKAGFVQPGDAATWEHHQHLCPLIWPGLPLFVEVHRRPSTPAWIPRVEGQELMSFAIPSATGVDGLLAPAPPVHALLLAAHSCIHQRPLERLIDLIDIAAVLTTDDLRRQADDLARRWGWERMWGVTVSAIDAVLGSNARSPIPKWAGHLATAREQTVLEHHIARFAGPASMLPRRRAHVAIASGLRRTVSRCGDEHWGAKLRRSRLAVAHAFMPQSGHSRTVSGRAGGDR
jgi:hypothetical protein